jgi:zinc transporter ZupT
MALLSRLGSGIICDQSPLTCLLSSASQRSYADVVTAFVAMASHKWVESIAVASVFMAAGSGFLAIVGFLVPFSLGPLVGIAIGVSVSNSNNWAVLVLFGLVSGRVRPLVELTEFLPLAYCQGTT